MVPTVPKMKLLLMGIIFQTVRHISLSMQKEELMRGISRRIVRFRRCKHPCFRHQRRTDCGDQETHCVVQDKGNFEMGKLKLK
ncbi:hypothetical protein CEXT_680971 [Caerostris extrusa]|uniref:Uncharacterized protein n=1 Tax=Caerostris extrusa TaxID=172846 RepID=A0AAV4X5I1_CAEEX|nr:hypothetical protein CEXT_680971 [Caerostris extrusa]